MRRLIPLVVLLLAACGEKPPSQPPPGENPPAGNIQGSLTVHTRYRDPAIPQEDLQSVHVLLGDGSRYRQPIDATGSAHFEDAALVGPQDITVVMVTSDGEVWVDTFLAVDQPDVSPHLFTLPPVVSEGKKALLSGRVTGADSGAGDVNVLILGDGVWGYATATAEGTFTADLWGRKDPTRVDVFVEQNAVGTSEPVRVGLLRDVAVSRGQTVSGLELVLDHPVDQSFSVAVNGLRPYGTEARTSLAYYQGLYAPDYSSLFSTSTAGSPPMALPAIARTAPFDTTRPMLTVTASERRTLPSGYSRTRLPVGEASSATATLLAPVVPVSLPLGPESAPGVVSRSGLVLRWTIDPAAQMGEVWLSPTGEQASPVRWKVRAPASVTSFTPFALPADVSPQATLGTGPYRVETYSYYRSDAAGYEEQLAEDHVFLGPPSAEHLFVEKRETRLEGHVVLE